MPHATKRRAEPDDDEGAAAEEEEEEKEKEKEDTTTTAEEKSSPPLAEEKESSPTEAEESTPKSSTDDDEPPRRVLRKRTPPNQTLTPVTENTKSKKKNTAKPDATEKKKRGRPRKSSPEGDKHPEAEKKKRGRPRKKSPEKELSDEPKSKRGRPRKTSPERDESAEPKRPRGRPRKPSPEKDEQEEQKKPRGRPKKTPCSKCQTYEDRIARLKLKLKQAKEELEQTKAELKKLKRKQNDEEKSNDAAEKPRKKRKRTETTATDTTETAEAKNESSQSKESTETTDDADAAEQKDSAKPVNKRPGWEGRFNQLLCFKEEHGHCRVPKSYKLKDLCSWVRYLRAMYWQTVDKGEYNSTLTRERVERLEAVGFEWKVDVKIIPWEDRFSDLLAFKAKFGHTRVPLYFKDDPALAQWVRAQRYMYKEKKPCIQGERTNKLNSIGFEWKVSDAGVTWEERYEMLVEYRKKHGHVNVPPQREIDMRADEEKEDGKNTDDAEDNDGTYNLTVEDERALSRWVRYQRNQYFKLKSGEYSRTNWSKVKKLEELGFDWNQDQAVNARRAKEVNHVPWETRIEQLKEYKGKNGNTNVPSKYKDHEDLGAWAARMRAMCRKWSRGDKYSENFTQEQFDQLQGLGFDYAMETETPKHAGWNERYQQLVDYKRQYGNTLVPVLWEGNPQLFNWVNEQRRQYRMKNNGKRHWLTPDRMALLEEIDFDWSAQQHHNETQLVKPAQNLTVGTLQETEEQAEEIQEGYQMQTEPIVPRLPPHQEYAEQQTHFPPPPPPSPPRPFQGGYGDQRLQSQPHPGYAPAEHAPHERYMDHMTHHHQGYHGNYAMQQGRHPYQNESQYYQPHPHDQSYGGQAYGRNYY